MDLNKLVSKLDEIPFEKWKRERNHSNWNEYKTKINGAKITLGILYPQEYIDDTKITLNIYSKKNELLIEDLYSQKIGKIAMKLEKKYDEKSRKEEYDKSIEKKDKLTKFLESI